MRIPACVALVVLVGVAMPVKAGTGGWSNANDRYVLMGRTSSGESVSLNVDSIQRTGKSAVSFAYWIQRDYVKAIANCEQVTFTVNWLNGKPVTPRTYSPENHSVSDRMVASVCGIGLR